MEAGPSEAVKGWVLSVWTGGRQARERLEEEGLILCTTTRQIDVTPTPKDNEDLRQLWKACKRRTVYLRVSRTMDI
jgi:hypothetical protein